ncbi:hypothetical protein FACS1894107_10050 [Planctomycetales bacterium]|nr:hypothetical protein FACS1894107_10050 [Planctomycetales bacterium]GHS96882.1 hypothetical protein FACS1894108_02320 [Planctomycetales bacterium]
MSALTFNFDNLGLFDLLTGAGVPEKQARAQVEVVRKTVVEAVAAVREEVKVEMSAQVAEVRKEVADRYVGDEEKRKELATKGDIGDLKVECARIRADVDVKLAHYQSEITKTMVSLIIGSTIATIVGMSAIMLSFFGHYLGK